MAVPKNMVFMGESTAVRQCFGALNFVLKVLVVAKRIGVCHRSSGRQPFETSLYPMTAEIT